MRIKKIKTAIKVISVIGVMFAVGVLVVLFMMANGHGGKYPIEIIISFAVIESVLIMSIAVLSSFLEKERQAEKKTEWEKLNKSEEGIIKRINKIIRIISVIAVLLSVGIMVSWWMFTSGHSGKYHMAIHLSLIVVEFALGMTILVLVSIREKERKEKIKQDEKKRQDEKKEQ